MGWVISLGQHSSFMCLQIWSALTPRFVARTAPSLVTMQRLWQEQEARITWCCRMLDAELWGGGMQIQILICTTLQLTASILADCVRIAPYILTPVDRFSSPHYLYPLSSVLSLAINEIPFRFICMIPVCCTSTSTKFCFCQFIFLWILDIGFDGHRSRIAKKT